jgi:succinyl-diaminopimelate desuccinylase
MVGIIQVRCTRHRAPTHPTSAARTPGYGCYHNVPAYVYGPFPSGMGAADEHVPIEDFLHIVRTHVLSAYDYLTRD